MLKFVAHCKNRSGILPEYNECGKCGQISHKSIRILQMWSIIGETGISGKCDVNTSKFVTFVEYGQMH